MNATDIANIAYQAGFRGAGLVNAVAVALAESHGDPNAHCLNCLGVTEDSRGLWQINVNAHPQYNTSGIYDPLANAQAAYAISNGGSDFRPWSTWPGAAGALLVQAANAVANAGISVVPGGPQPIAPGLPVGPITPNGAPIIPPITIPSAADVGAAITGAGQGIVQSIQQGIEPITSGIANLNQWLGLLGNPDVLTGGIMVAVGVLITLLGIILFGVSLLPKGSQPALPIPV